MELEGDASSAGDGTAVAGHLRIVTAGRTVRVRRRTAVARRHRREAAVTAGGEPVIRDAATGLVPRATFTARLQEQLALGVPVGVVALGVDWIDGHASQSLADPTLMSTIAKRLTSGLRSTDLVASFGADGFMALLADVPAPEVIHAIARRLVAAASGPVSLMGRTIDGRATASFSMVTAAELDAEQLVACAMRARLRARALGGDRVLPFDPADGGDDLSTVSGWSLEELEGALQDGEFEAWFQPVVDVATADLVGFEALVRWMHPEFGVLEPAQFLEAAEDGDLLGRVSTEIMRQALRHLARWDDRVPGRLSMSVNLSARHLAVPDLTDTIADLVSASGMAADRLRIDVSERTLTADPDAVAVHVTSLRRQGVRVCLDDFGAGSTSMALLQRIPFDVLKLDRGLLDAAGSDTGRTVLDALVRFGHSVGATVLAEGVETPRELAVLRTAGCDQAQGKLFSGARSASEIDAMLDKWLGVPSPAPASEPATAPAPVAAGGPLAPPPPPAIAS